MAWEEWTEDEWKVFVGRNQVDGGIVARIPASTHVHCRSPACLTNISRGRSPLMQLYYTREDSSSIFCVPCARNLPVMPVREEPAERRALWMQYEPREAERHLGE